LTQKWEAEFRCYLDDPASDVFEYLKEVAENRRPMDIRDHVKTLMDRDPVKMSKLIVDHYPEQHTRVLSRLSTNQEAEDWLLFQ
jgi:hypothetical protein